MTVGQLVGGEWGRGALREACVVVCRQDTQTLTSIKIRDVSLESEI